jgi:hypothetical protein
MLCEDPDAAAGLVSFREVNGNFGSGEEAEVLGAGGEGTAPDSQGAGGGCDGPVVPEGLADLGFVEFVAAVRSPPARGASDASESGLDAVTGHTGRFGQRLERFTGLVPPAEIAVVHGPQCDRRGRYRHSYGPRWTGLRLPSSRCLIFGLTSVSLNYLDF